MWLAQVDQKTVETAVIHVEKQPWIAVVVVLSCICAVMLSALIWGARSGLPWMDRRQQSSQDHVMAMLAARGKESERDLQQLTEQLVSKLGSQLERQGDSIGYIRTELARITAKVCGAIVLIILASALAGSDRALALGIDFSPDPRPAGLYGAR